MLWNVTAISFEGRTCALAAYGRSKRGLSEPQLLFGLLMTGEGVPVSVEVFAGNKADPATVSEVVERVRETFGLKRVVVVGDRGMLTETRIEEDLRPRALDWITSLRAPTIRKLWQDGPLQLSLFDDQDLVAITEEAALDGIYVIRTSVSAERMGSEDMVGAYKSLSLVERAFRICRDFALEVEPIRHRLEDRVRAHAPS